MFSLIISFFMAMLNPVQANNKATSNQQGATMSVSATRTTTSDYGGETERVKPAD